VTIFAHVVGARPNFMKIAPVIRALRARLPAARQVVVHTGQHYDHSLSDIFLDELDVPAPDHFLEVGSGGHGVQTGRILERIESVFEADRPDVVFVPGDVNSTLAAALAAAKLQIPIAHVEAGLRSFDRTMPEEINRVVADQLAQWCFTHSPEAEPNLLREGVAPERIHMVGNTMIDTLVRFRPAIEASDVHARLGLEARRYLLVTLHRPALVDGPLLARALAALGRLSHTLPVVFPMHPRTRQHAVLPADAPDLKPIEPIGYVDFLALQLRAAAVITDSGGVQEETTYLRVPCFTLRDTTERPITVEAGTNTVLGLEVERVEEIPGLLEKAKVPMNPPPGWDGRAAERIAEIMAGAFGEGEGDLCAESAAR
jgi:UDP-N-acetylglucosamine 2-epimerase (non-hydrolysing)